MIVILTCHVGAERVCHFYITVPMSYTPKMALVGSEENASAMEGQLAGELDLLLGALDDLANGC